MQDAATSEQCLLNNCLLHIFLPLMRLFYLVVLLSPVFVAAETGSVFHLPDDSSKVQRLLDLGYQYEFTNPDSALMVYALAGKISKKTDYKTGWGRSLNYSGIVEFSRGNYHEAEQYYNRSVEVFEKIPYPRGIAANYNNIGNIYHHLGEFDKTVQFHMKALAIFEEIADTLSMINNLNNLGTLYYDNAQYQPAISFYQQSAVLLEKRRDTVSLLDTYVNLANTYNRLQDNEMTRSYLQRADAVLYSGIGAYGRLLLSEAKREFYASMQDYNTAIMHSEESLALAKQLNNAYDFTRVLTSRAQIYTAIDKTREALGAYNMAIDTARHYQYLNLLARLYAGRSELLEDAGRFSAAHTDLKALIHLRDSLFKKERQEIIHEMEARYQNTKKQQLIEENEAVIAQQEFQAARQQSLFIWTTITAGGIIITILLGVAFLQQRRKALEAKVLNLEKEKELKNLKYIIEGEEKERSRLAKELHDGVNGSLAAIKLQAGSEKHLDNKGGETIKKMLKQIDDVSTEVREISHNLMPDVITQYGLTDAISSYLARIKNQDNIKIDFQYYGNIEETESSYKTTLYRIVQELVRNIIRHSGATECLIQINRHEENISLVVEDNGNGFNVFDHSRAENSDGIGLYSIYSRVNLMGGKIDIQSGLNAGTAVHIDIPLKPIEA